jgi:lipoyl(octanoyl) transferase
MESVAEEIEGSLRIVDCGLANYRKVLQLQRELYEKRRTGEIPNTALVVEHPPVITLGARQSANKLLISRKELAKRHIDVVDIRRGGGTTAHNPGQLVVYPILHLQQLGLGISEYIRQLEAIGAELLEQLGVQVKSRKGFPGLWVSEHLTDERERVTSHESRTTRKIASIGVRVSRFVTYHGMATNIQNDLSIFDLLIPCGLDGVEMTSVLKETGERHSMRQVKKRLYELLGNHFSPKARVRAEKHKLVPNR